MNSEFEKKEDAANQAEDSSMSAENAESSSEQIENSELSKREADAPIESVETEQKPELNAYDENDFDDQTELPQKKASAKKQWAGIIVVAGLASFSLFMAWQGQQNNAAQLSQINALTQKISDTQTTLKNSSFENKQLQDSLIALKANNQKQQAELASIPAQLQQQQKEQFEQYQSWIQQSLNKTEKAWADSSLAWRLAEIEFLLNGAHQTVIARGDHQTAAQMLDLADKRMGEIFQKDPQAVREVIAQAQLVLQNYQPANVLKLYNQILALETQIKSWQWQNATSVASEFTKNDVSAAPEASKKWYQRLDGYIKVRRATELDTNTILAPSQLEQVRLILLSATATLKAAAADQNAELFTLALNDLSSWSQSYLPEENQRMSIATQIKIWQDEKFEHERPDVFMPLSLFNEWKQELMP